MPQTAPRFSIQITTRDRQDDLYRTLSSLRPLIARPDVECVVYDDGSNDATSPMVRRDFPEIKLLKNETSRGLMFCRNVMLNQTQATYAISLDDDAEFLSDDPLLKIARHFESHSKCGVIAFRIFWGSDTPISLETQETQTRVKGFVGCGHAWRIKAWKAIADYPEWFVFYGEEEFASYQLFLNGLEVHYLPEILVHHRVDMKARKSNTVNQGIRQRRSLSSGWYLFHLFLPKRFVVKYMIHSVKTKIQQSFKNKDLLPVKTVGLSAIDLIRNSGRLLRERKAMTTAQFAEFSKLPATKVYWNPIKKQ